MGFATSRQLRSDARSGKRYPAPFQRYNQALGRSCAIPSGWHDHVAADLLSVEVLEKLGIGSIPEPSPPSNNYHEEETEG